MAVASALAGPRKVLAGPARTNSIWQSLGRGAAGGNSLRPRRYKAVTNRPADARRRVENQGQRPVRFGERRVAAHPDELFAPHQPAAILPRPTFRQRSSSPASSARNNPPLRPTLNSRSTARWRAAAIFTRTAAENTRAVNHGPHLHCCDHRGRCRTRSRRSRQAVAWREGRFRDH